MADSPTGYWRFGGANGTTAHDEMAGGLDGSYRDGVTLQHVGAIAGDSGTAAARQGAAALRRDLPDED
jgi:hypothetical protein